MAKFFLGVAVIVATSCWLGFYAYMSVCDTVPAQAVRTVI